MAMDASSARHGARHRPRAASFSASEVGDRAGEPLRLDRVERALTRINREAGVEASATLKPGAEQGFTNLPSEWWHYDFGDQLWAHYGGHGQALYGPAELDTIESRWRRQL